VILDRQVVLFIELEPRLRIGCRVGEEFQPFAEYTDKKAGDHPAWSSQALRPPIITGSGPTHETIRTFDTALCAAWIEAAPFVTMVISPSEPNSTVRAQRRSAFPSAPVEYSDIFAFREGWVGAPLENLSTSKFPSTLEQPEGVTESAYAWAHAGASEPRRGTPAWHCWSVPSLRSCGASQKSFKIARKLELILFPCATDPPGMMPASTTSGFPHMGDDPCSNSISQAAYSGSELPVLRVRRN